MPTVTVTSNDTLTLNGHVFADLSLADVTAISFPNELVSRKTGKNGNTIFAQSAQGLNGDLMIRVSRGSTDDQFLQGIISSAPADFPSTVLMYGTFVKRLGDGQGNVVSDVYTLGGGVISKQVEGKENVDGDVSQGEAVYSVKFANVVRSIG